MAVPKSLVRKKSKEDKQTLAELNSAHRYSRAKCQLVHIGGGGGWGLAMRVNELVTSYV